MWNKVVNVLGLGCASLALATFSGSVIWAQAPTAGPLVIGFERFARHAELGEQEAGRLLLSELSCTACHTTTDPELVGKAGPKLESVGRRLKVQWLADYLNDPARLKPGTTMPHLLHGMEPLQKGKVIQALVAFLSSQQAALPVLKASGANPVPHEFWNKGDVKTGQQLYHQSGCVACHQPAQAYAGGAPTNPALDQMLEELEPEQIAKLGLTHAAREIPSVPLPQLEHKYTAEGLAMFLVDPASVRPAGRMPNMKLRTADAADLAAWLMSTSDVASAMDQSQPMQLDVRALGSPAVREEGRQLFMRLGCVSCHTASGVKSAGADKPLQNLNPASERSCVNSPAASLPDYSLDEMQKSALRTALVGLKQSNTSSPQRTAAMQSQLAMLQLNCYACHHRDGLGGVARGRDRFFETKGQVDMGDEGRLPPPLTHVGRKLTTPHLKNVLAGNGDIRPHLQIRMPKYPPAEVDELVQQLSSADGVTAAPASKPPVQVDESLVRAGRVLFDLGCVQCHPVRGEALPSVVGVDLGRIGTRVRREWFNEFLLNPASLKPRTRMPTFFAPGSVNQQVLKGEVNQQIEALWNYLEDIYRQPLPDKIEQVRRQNFELVPRDKPIILRTFMLMAGTHAIAVGFPGRVNYAFDSETVRLAELWGDRFLDAQGTWTDRFAPEAVPLSTQRIPLPGGPDFGLLANRSAPWPELKQDSPLEPPSSQARFMGYRLDTQGVPEFHYRVGPYEVFDQLIPANRERLEAAARSTNPLDARVPAAKIDGIASGKAFLRNFRVVLNSTASKNSDPLWYRVIGTGKPLQRAPGGWTYASGLTVTLSEAMNKSAYSRTLPGQTQVLIPLAPVAETRFSVLYSW